MATGLETAPATKGTGWGGAAAGLGGKRRQRAREGSGQGNDRDPVVPRNADLVQRAGPLCDGC